MYCQCTLYTVAIRGYIGGCFSIHDVHDVHDWALNLNITLVILRCTQLEICSSKCCVLSTGIMAIQC